MWGVASKSVWHPCDKHVRVLQHGRVGVFWRHRQYIDMGSVCQEFLDEVAWWSGSASWQIWMDLILLDYHSQNHSHPHSDGHPSSHPSASHPASHPPLHPTSCLHQHRQWRGRRPALRQKLLSRQKHPSHLSWSEQISGELYLGWKELSKHGFQLNQGELQEVVIVWKIKCYWNYLHY